MKNRILDITNLVGDYLLFKRIPTGIERVCLEYARYFRGKSSVLVRFPGRWVIFERKESEDILDALLTPKLNDLPYIYSHLVKEFTLKKSIFSPHALLINPSAPRLTNRNFVKFVLHYKLKPIFFLHDLIPITHPEYCIRNASRDHKEKLSIMHSVGRGIITNSHSVREEFQRYNLDKSLNTTLPCVVAPLAGTPLPKPADQRPIASPYFIVIGTIEPRKNHLLLLQAWQKLAQKFGDATPKLIIIGKRGWNINEEVRLLDHCPMLKGHVIEKPHCKDIELATWLHYSQALLFPTFVEGFGLPLHEALEMGVPVIASNLSVFYETAGNIPEYLDPTNLEDWKQMIISYMELNSAYRLAQCERIKHYQAPTWKKHFELVEELIDMIID